MVTGVRLNGTPVVIPVGGKGTRLGLPDLPKPMVDFGGRPLLERTILDLKAQGLTRFIFLAGFGADRIIDYFGDGSSFGVQIETVVETAPLGSAGSFALIRDRLKLPFLVFYGDIVFDIDVARFVSFAAARGALGTLYVHPNDHPFDSDLVDVDADARIVGFVAKPHGDEACGNLVSAAIYYLYPEIIERIPAGSAGPIDWGHDIFPGLIANGRSLFAYRGTEYVKDIGTPDRIRKARLADRNGRVAARSYARRQRAIFLDRDGVLNAEIDGVHRRDMLELLPGVGEAVKRINDSGFLAICVTNQPAVAKGFMTFEDLKRVHWKLDADLARAGAFLDDLYFCPHHPERGFEGEVASLKVDCQCRKPQPGMLLAAAERHNIDLAQSYMIGDSSRDILAGKAAGVASCYLVGTDRQTGDVPDGARKATTLADAVSDVLAREKIAA